MGTRPNGHIWMAAEGFYNAAELVWSSEGFEPGRHGLPLVVHYALCSELSLKAAEGITVYGPVSPAGLISAATLKSAVRGHQLDEVFADLQPATQSSVAAEFANATGEEQRTCS